MVDDNIESCSFCGDMPKDGIIVKIRSWYPVFLVRWLVSRAIKKDRSINVR